MGSAPRTTRSVAFLSSWGRSSQGSSNGQRRNARVRERRHGDRHIQRAMSSNRGPASPEALLAEAGWLRRLARSLVGDGAEDAVQQTYLAAIVSPPAGDRPLRPWLAQVLRNFVRMRVRRERRAVRWSVAAGSPPPVDLNRGRTGGRTRVYRSTANPELNSRMRETCTSGCGGPGRGTSLAYPIAASRAAATSCVSRPASSSRTC